MCKDKKYDCASSRDRVVELTETEGWWTEALMALDAGAVSCHVTHRA